MSTSDPAAAGFSGTHMATILSWISSSVGISTSWIAPLPQWPAERLDPEARAAIVIDAILIMIEIAVALHQAETARIVVEESETR